LKADLSADQCYRTENLLGAAFDERPHVDLGGVKFVLECAVASGAGCGAEARRKGPPGLADSRRAVDEVFLFGVLGGGILDLFHGSACAVALPESSERRRLPL
jgi:hypothetical protein